MAPIKFLFSFFPFPFHDTVNNNTYYCIIIIIIIVYAVCSMLSVQPTNSSKYPMKQFFFSVWFLQDVKWETKRYCGEMKSFQLRKNSIRQIEKVFINTHTKYTLWKMYSSGPRHSFDDALVKCIFLLLFFLLVIRLRYRFAFNEFLLNLSVYDPRENKTMIAHSNDHIHFFLLLLNLSSSFSASSSSYWIFPYFFFPLFKFIFAFWLRSTLLHKDTDSNMYN